MRDIINKRFFDWANSILDKMGKLEPSVTNNIIIYQLTKSCLSSTSNYRVSIRAKSTRDLINKLKITEEELDESVGWLEILQYRSSLDFKLEIKEANELLSIVVSSIISLKKKSNIKH